MSKVYDPILCMMVEKPTYDADSLANQIKQKIQSIHTARDYEEAIGFMRRAYNDGRITPDEFRKFTEMLQKKRIKGVNDANHVGEFYQLRFSSGKIEGARLTNEEMRSYAESLLKKYGEKQVTISKNGKVVKTFLFHDSVIDRAIRAVDEKGYELDGFYIKPTEYGYEVTKNGKKLGEFATTREAESWIRKQYGDR